MNVALLGLGFVGRGVYDIISNDFTDITVKYILEKDDSKIKGLEALRASSIEDIINDDEINVVIELIGGKTVAYDYVVKALKHKKHVVTANKALISEKFKELTSLASKHNVSLLYEASVGGAIIVLDELKSIAKINKINKIEGIVNGSTNYILSRVFLNSLSMEDAINEAFEQGYLETGSTDDMDGLDALRKINILSMIAYDTYFQESDYHVVPLSNLSKELIEYIKSKGYLIKYLVSSELINDVMVGYVCATVIDDSSVISKINYEENIITVHGEYHKKQSFIGQGAGRYPTASAVVYDLLTLNKQNQVKQNHEKVVKTDLTLKKYYFLVQTSKGIVKTDKQTFNDILCDQDVRCFVMIEEGLYEKI